MTFADMLTEVKYRCALENESSFDAGLKRSLNFAQQLIARRFLWPFLETEGTVTTVASTETYTLPTDCMHVLLVRNTTSNRKLTYISLRDFYERFPYPTATGTPSQYRLPGVVQTLALDPTPQIAFYPIPDAAYTLKVLYYIRLTDMTTTDTVSRIPAQFHEILIDYAASLYFAREGDARAQSHHDAFENGLLDMTQQLQGEPVDRFDVLQSIDEGSHTSPFIPFPSTFERLS